MRNYTNALLEMIEDGVLDPKDMVRSLCLWMSEDDVEEFMRAYELVFDDEEEEF